MKKILYFVILIGFLFSENENYNKALKLLNNAKTYHWLGRYKFNDVTDFKTSKDFFNQALNEIKGFNDSDKKDFIYNQIKSGLNEIDIRYDNNFDNINNEYPLYNILYGHTKTYEFFDDPDVIAVKNAADEVSTEIPKATGTDFQYSGLIISDPENHHIEDELFAILNSKVNFFPRPKEEILDVVSKYQYKKLYSGTLESETLKKLANSFNKDDIFIGKVTQNDLVNDVTYMGVYIDEWSVVKNRITKSIYADGFVEDRRNYLTNTLYLFFILLCFSLFIPKLQNLILKFKKNDYESNTLYWTSAFSFICSIIIIYLSIKFLSVLAPSPDSLAILPLNRIWIILFHLAIVIIPTVIIYFICILMPNIKEKIHDKETLAAFLAGIGLGTTFFFTALHNLKYLNIDLVYYQISMLILFLIYSCWVSEYLSKLLLENNLVDSIPFVSYLFIFNINTYSIMRNDFSIMNISNILLLIFPIGFIIINKKIVNKKIELDKDKPTEKISIKTLHENINYPPKFIDPSVDNNFIYEAADRIIQDNTKLNTLLLSGPQGSGKTRAANEIANEIIKRYNNENNSSNYDENWILFGDCDELNKEGSGVPFEPFSQALHKVLGAGRFEPPSKKADKIKEGLNNAGLDKVLDATGLGILNMLMGSKNDEIGTASISEMTHIVSKTIMGLSKKRPVVFIIDDLHWIDNISYKLFEGILNEQELINKNIYFIFTLRNNLELDNNTIDFLEKTEHLSLKKISSDNFNIKNKFGDLLKSLKFEPKSVNRYLKYIADYDVDNILTLLQSLKQLIDNDAIEIKDELFKIKNNFKLKNLEPPLDIVTVIKEQLKSISDDQFQIIKFAAFIGSEFKASVLSEALKMRRLTVLYDLEELEKKDIIIDIKNQDDVYKFKSNAMINVVRYMYRVTAKEIDEIPQLVREYHFRIADSIEKNMETKNILMHNMPDQTIYNLAKRSWASGDRMLTKAFTYNFEAQKRAYTNDRFEESIHYSKNILEVINKIDYNNILKDVIRSFMLSAQAKIYIDYPSKDIDDTIEETKKIIKKLRLEIQEEWMIKILNIEADAFIHDHSGYFEDQKNEILKQINKALNDSQSINIFDKIYAELSLLRINNELENKIKIETLKNLLDNIKNVDKKNVDSIDSSISAFSNNPEIDFEKLKSEILEEKIKLMIEIADEPQKIISTIMECIEIKSDINVNDKEGLAQSFKNLGIVYLSINNIDNALKYFDKSIILSKQIGNKYIEIINRIKKGTILLNQKKYNLAKKEYENANAKHYDDIELKYKIIIGLLKTSEPSDKNNYITEAKKILKINIKDQKLYNQLKDALNE